jgi:hypothetical protein
MSKKIIRLTESDLVRIVRKVLNEQLIGTLASRPAFNLSKSAPKTSSSRTPQVQDDITGESDACTRQNIRDVVNQCKKDKSKYNPDKDAYYIAKQLYTAMKGISTGTETLNTLHYLISDTPKFCRVSNAFNYDGENLAQWLDSEISLYPKLVWRELKSHAEKLKLTDNCWADINQAT